MKNLNDTVIRSDKVKEILTKIIPSALLAVIALLVVGLFTTFSSYASETEKISAPYAPIISFSKNSIDAIRFNIDGVDCDGYQVKYTTKSNMTSYKTATIKADATTGRIGDLHSGTYYYIQLRAYNKDADGNKVYSDWSEKIKGVTKSKPTTIKFTKRSSNAVRVKIKTTRACYKYQVRYSTKSSMSSAKTINASSSATEVRIPNLTSGTKYYAQIRTYVKLGNKYWYSSWSKKIEVAPKTEQPKLKNIATASDVSVIVGQVCYDSTKKPKSITGYQIQYSTSKKFSTSKKITSRVASDNTTNSFFRISSLKKNTTYYLRARSYVTCDGTKYYGAWSNISSIKTKKKLISCNHVSELNHQAIPKTSNYTDYYEDLLDIGTACDVITNGVSRGESYDVCEKCGLYVGIAVGY